MNFRKTVLIVLAVFVLATPLMAQDSGAPDSLKMVFTTTPVVGNNVPVVVQCSVYVDANSLSTLQYAWKWDNPNFDLDSAKASTVFDAMDIGPFFFLDNSLQTTNDSQIAIASGTSIFSNYPPGAGWRHIATFYGHMTSWSSTSFLRIDTVQTPTYASTEYLFLPLGGIPYGPVWKGPITFGNQPQILQVTPSVLNKSANEGGASPTPDTIDVTVDAGGSIGFNLSESIPWLTLNKASGNTPDEFVITYNTSSLAPGSYADSIQVSSSQADNSPFWVKVNLTISAVPKFLDVSPDSLYFTAQENSANPAQKRFAVTETGGFAIAYTVAETSARLTLNKAGGTTPDSVGVNVNIAGLVPGVYIDSVIVASGAASNSPIKEYVKTTITAALLLDVSPDTLSFTFQEGASPAQQSFAVTEIGGSAIAYSVTETSIRLTLNKAGGTTPDSVGVNVNIAGLVPGIYIDSVIVASGAASNSPIKEYVRTTITAAPKFLDVIPDTLYFTAQENAANPPQQRFRIVETGGFAIAYAAAETSSRLTLSKTSGTTPDSIGVNVIITGLTPGVYIDSVAVTSAAASNSPVKEYIRTTITAAPKFLDVVPDTLSFTAQESGFNPASKKFLVRETGNYNIAYTLAEATDWFALDRAGGTTPESVLVTVDITGLAPATYYGSITVASGAAGNSPITETIKLVITAIPRLLLASPNSFSFEVVDGGAPFSPATVHVTDSFNVGIAYTVGDGIDWANVSPSSGTTPDSFLIIADTAAVNALPPGFYQDTILITAGTASNSPVRVFVSLEISAQPNNPPVILAIDNYFIFEGDHLVVSVVATDADGDQLYLSTSLLPANAAFFDSGNGNGYLTFDPNYNQAGGYPITIYASDLDDTTSEDFFITVTDREPGTEGDTLHVGTVPAVPGQQVVVPIDIANSCDVYGIYIPIQWDGDNFIVLDSIIFNDALVGHLSAKSVDISNDSNFALITVQVIAPDLPIPPGHALLANMYFSVSPVAPQGVYGVIPGLTTTTFTRNCGVQEDIIPVVPGGGGNIIVDTTNVFVCGYVVDEDGVGIGGATVELWGDYPCDGPLQTTTTSGDGAYAFTGFTLGSYDLYAYKRGLDSTTWNDAYYPQVVHVNFGENGIIIELQWLDILTPSDVWVDYFCGSNTLFGCPLPVGSIVEVRDPQNVLSGRQFVSESGVYRFMPVYRDSAGSVEDEGATTGDNLRFYVNGVQALTTGNTIYPAAYEQIQVCLAGGERLTKECLLNTGWNLTSWNLDTDTDDIEDVLSSLEGCIEVVLGYEQGGLTYVPGMDIFNTLSAVDHLSGYWIKLGDGCNHNLVIEGVPVDQDTPIPVNSRWNLVSYLPNDILAVEDALYSLTDNLQIAYTYDGAPLVYVPGMDPVFNTLTEMEPCFGYWLKLDHDGVLTYPAASGAMPKIEWPIAQEALGSQDKLVEPTRNWVNMYSHNLTIDGQPVSIGTTVTAHNMNGNTIGHYVMKASGTFGFMPVYADAQDESVAGIKKGERFYLSVDGQKTSEEFTWTEQGALIEVAALTTGASGGNNLPDAYVLEQNYPNPFNPSTTISFSLPTASQATLEIFNLLGQIVATPYDGFAEAGEHRIEWDGRTITGETASSGIYLYRLTAGEYVKTLKMTLVK